MQECSGGYPEWHIQGDCLPFLDGRCVFITMDGMQHEIAGKWDIIIAHPPCTYLSNAGAGWLFPNGELNEERYQKGLQAKEFFMRFFNADCPRICIENPVASRIYELPQYTQIVEPYEFGHLYSKRTCLWLVGLPPLFPKMAVYDKSLIESTRTADWYNKGGKERQKNRSKTFSGIADAMAEQWG